MEILPKKRKKLKLESVYPYTYARVAVMRSKLLKKDQYNQLLKMSFPEISRFLQSGNYKEDIDALALHLSGAQLIESAVHRSMGTAVKKLKKISEGNLKTVIEAYLKRRDSHNIKTLIRGITANIPFEEIQQSLMEGGSKPTESYKGLYEKKEIKELLKTLPFLESSQVKNLSIEYQKDKDIFALENKLDECYCSHMIDFANSLPKHGKIMKQFLLKEIEITNIMTILRLKKEKVNKESILKYLFIADNGQKAFYKKLLSHDDIDSLINSISRSLQDQEMRKTFETYKHRKSLSSIEISLSKYLLKKTILYTHQNPVSVDVILAYLLALEIEAKNITIIAKAKEAELSEEKIRELLVI